MDRASQVLAQRLFVDEPRTYAALSEISNVPISTLNHRDRGRRSREELAQRQQYLTLEEEKALVKFLLLMSNLRHPKRHNNYIYNKDPAILSENVYNMDETGVMLSMLGSVKVLVGKDDLRDYRGAGVKQTTVTAIECISADGSNWMIYPTPGWHYSYSENGYNNLKISLEWLMRVFNPQTKEQANGRPRVLICDGFGTHETLETLQFCLEHNIVLCRLPSHTSHKLQPCDVGAFASLKTAYRDEVERLNRGGVDTVGKEHFTPLYKPARERALTKRNIIAGWAATSLFPFNPERVLRGIQKPSTEVTIPNANELTPITPVTPATTEALTSLHNLINKDAHALDKTSKQRLQRHVQKLASAAKTSFTECALLQDQNRFLLKTNNEAKVRRSTRSVVLGKAKVMSYKDLEEARAKRNAKEKAIASKGKRGQAEAEVEAEVASSVPKDKVARISEVEPAKDAPMPWRIPVAKMY
ncbi:DDE-domain-containing protein, partial [Lophiostoma macrostomum CBS 122681]